MPQSWPELWSRFHACMHQSLYSVTPSTCPSQSQPATQPAPADATLQLQPRHLSLCSYKLLLQCNPCLVLLLHPCLVLLLHPSTNMVLQLSIQLALPACSLGRLGTIGGQSPAASSISNSGLQTFVVVPTCEIAIHSTAQTMCSTTTKICRAGERVCLNMKNLDRRSCP